MARDYFFNAKVELFEEIKEFYQEVEQQVDSVSTKGTLKEALDITNLRNAYYQNGSAFNLSTKKYDPLFYNGFKNNQIESIKKRKHQLGLLQIKSKFMYHELISIIKFGGAPTLLNPTEEERLLEDKFQSVQRQYNTIRDKINEKSDKLKITERILKERKKL